MAKPYLRFILACAVAVGVTLPLDHQVRADHDYGPACHDKLQNDKARIDRDAARHGEHSSRVDHDVAKMENDRAWCRDHHADWDHSLFDVGIYVRH